VAHKKYNRTYERTPLPAALICRGNKGSATPRNLLHCTTIGFSSFPGSRKICLTAPVEPDAIEGRVVLDNVSKQIRECLEHAQHCARQAAALPADSPSRLDYLQLEGRWLALARNIGFGERLDSFAKNASRSSRPDNDPHRRHRLRRSDTAHS
jgi:hypothetical protein